MRKVETASENVDEVLLVANIEMIPRTPLEDKFTGRSESLHDLFGSLTSGYARFQREIIRAQASKRRIVIIIEGGLTRFLEGVRYSKAQGLSIVKTLFTLKVKYGVDFVFLQDRRETSEYIVQHYYAEWKLKNSGGR